MHFDLLIYNSFAIPRHGTIRITAPYPTPYKHHNTHTPTNGTESINRIYTRTHFLLSPFLVCSIHSQTTTFAPAPAPVLENHAVTSSSRTPIHVQRAMLALAHKTEAPRRPRTTLDCELLYVVQYACGLCDHHAALCREVRWPTRTSTSTASTEDLPFVQLRIHRQGENLLSFLCMLLIVHYSSGREVGATEGVPIAQLDL